MQREALHFDILIVGAGPAGLSAAIRFKQLCQKQQKELSICVVEKGASVGAHILSGAVLQPDSLNQLLPDWQEQDAPAHTAVTSDRFLYLTRGKTYRLPTPKPMRNEGNYIISLSQFCRWLASHAERLGVDIYPGFAAAEILYDDNNKVIGIATGDMGLDKQGNKTDSYQAGVALYAKQTLFAEGCRGSLSEQIIQHFNLRDNKQAQTYAIGLKEIWQVPSEQHQAGSVIHTVGWPLDQSTYGGSFIYHWQTDHIVLGLVIGLDYQNPWLDPFAEFQRFKTHPLVKSILSNSKRITYGAKALNEGGWQSIPKLTFPGGMIIGDSAGFVNVPKIKGIHNAIQSGILAAEATFSALQQDDAVIEIVDYNRTMQQSSVWHELYRVRNIRPAFRYGLWPGLAYAAIDTYLLQGKAPWTLKHRVDHQSLKKANDCKAIQYPAADNKLTFDRASSVYLSNTYHTENQPCHLQLKDKNIPIDTNWQEYRAPEQRYCPAGVYEIQQDDGQVKLQINAQNCIHCKTCDIKDPKQNIVWQVPEGGGGPNYSDM